MKKMLRILALCMALLTTLCVIATAANDAGTAPTQPGIYDLKIEQSFDSAIKVTPQDAAGNTVTASMVTINGETKELYANAVRMSVAYNGGVSGSQYIVMIMEGSSGTPSVENLAYINQNAARTFDTVYPKTLESGKVYHIYLSSNAASGITTLTEVGSFKYYSSASYRLGDVNKDGEIDALDMQRIYAHLNRSNPLEEIYLPD